MKKLFLTIFALVLFNISTFGQIEVFNGVVSAGGSSDDYVYGSYTDSEGNTYITGKTKSAPMNFGNGISVSTRGNYDMYVAKYNNEGTALWAKSAGSYGSSSADDGRAVTVDAEGNVYVTGAFFNKAFFGDFNSDSLVSYGNFDAYLAKYDADGNYQWVRHLHTANQDVGNSIDIDSQGSIIVGGYFGDNEADTLVVGDIRIPSYGERDMFVVKFDLYGNALWGVAGGSSVDNDENKALIVDNNDNIYVTGFYSEGDATFGTITIPFMEGDEIYICRIDQNGNFVWATGITGPGNDNGRGLDFTTDGPEEFPNLIFVTGDFNDTSYAGSTMLISNGDDDMFIAALNANDGTFYLVEGFGGTMEDKGYTVQFLDGTDGTYYIGGNSESEDFQLAGNTMGNNGGTDAFIMKSVAGEPVWIRNFGGELNDLMMNIGEDSEHNVYPSGYFKSTSAVFDDTTIATNGGYDAWVGVINPLAPTSVEVTFQVDMSVKVGNGSFDPTTQVVTVPGGFNNWLNEPPANSEKVMEDADGDYIYTKTIEMEPSTSYQYKYNIGTGWDGLDESSNRTFTSGTSDEVLPVVFYNGTTAGSNSVVTFEVDMSLKAQAGFDPTTENVYVAGSFNGWSTSASQMLDADGDSVYSVVIDSLTVGEEYYFKYIYSGGAVTWEDVENRAFTPTNSEDSYFAWWNNVEEQGNVSDGTIQFQIDMSVMSEAGIYDNFTDSLQVRGNFNGWGDADKMDQDPLNADQWYKSVSFEATEVGSEQNYKYFVLLANASVSNMWTDGWERPFSEGGGNRDVNFEGTETQVVDYVYYDDVQPNWVIPTGTTVSIEFSVNMTVAADPTQQVPTFNPSTDTLWWIAEQPAFTYLMGWTDTDNMKEVMMSDADGDMIYTGTLTVEGPAWNGFEYRYGFSHSLGYTTEPAGYGDFAYRVRFINQTGDREFVQPYSAPVDEWSLVENKEDQWESEPMYVGIDENGTEVATYSLSQNYPNPFNPSTQINFSLASNGLVSLKIYNILGQEVATLINREMTSGVHSFNFDASKLTSGIYFYTLQSGNFTATKKMIFLK